MPAILPYRFLGILRAEDMKHPILLMSLVGFLVVSDGNPFADLGAAEVWNSQSKRQITSDKRTIFNKSKNSNIGKGPTTLYNRQSNSNINASSHGGLDARIQSYGNIGMTQQVPSKLWGLLSPSALENKQADIDYALQNEYERKKATAKVVIEAMKDFEAQRLKMEREYQAKMARYGGDRDRMREEQKALQAKALQAAQSSENDSADVKNSRSGVRTQENAQVLKGSAKLFNSSE